MAFPFPEPRPDQTLIATDEVVEAALAAAVIETQAAFPAFANSSRLALSIVAVDSTSPASFRHAGLQAGETCYSASLLKVAAMYAAFELRRAVNALGPAVGSGPELFAACRASFDPVIEPAVPQINDAGIARALRLPRYEEVFVTIPVLDGGIAADFSAAFESNLRDALIPGDNAAAGRCVRALGYSWINGALAAGGFFDGQKGIWLAGTFMQDQPYVRISSINDGAVAQATTTFDMANLYAHMLAASLVDAESSAQMLALLAEAAAGSEPSFLSDRRSTGSQLLTVTNTKIGLGPLKTGGTVASEASVLTEPSSLRQFIVVFQNALNDTASLAAVTFLVERTIGAIINAP